MGEPEQERARCATVLAEMFLGLGRDSTTERIAYYLRLLGRIPADLLREACDAAVLARNDDWVPGPGAIETQARAILGARRTAERSHRAERLRLAERRTVELERAAGSRVEIGPIMKAAGFENGPQQDGPPY